METGEHECQGTRRVAADRRIQGGWPEKDSADGSREHESIRRIVGILDKDRDDYTEDDVSHMRDVEGYVHRHQA